MPLGLPVSFDPGRLLGEAYRSARQYVDDAYWAVSHPVDRMMGRGRAANPTMAIPVAPGGFGGSHFFLKGGGFRSGPSLGQAERARVELLRGRLREDRRRAQAAVDLRQQAERLARLPQAMPARAIVGDARATMEQRGILARREGALAARREQEVAGIRDYDYAFPSLRFMHRQLQEFQTFTEAQQMRAAMSRNRGEFPAGTSSSDIRGAIHGQPGFPADVRTLRGLNARVLHDAAGSRLEHAVPYEQAALRGEGLQLASGQGIPPDVVRRVLADQLRGSFRNLLQARNMYRRLPGARMNRQHGITTADDLMAERLSENARAVAQQLLHYRR